MPAPDSLVRMVQLVQKLEIILTDVNAPMDFTEPTAKTVNTKNFDLKSSWINKTVMNQLTKN